MELLQTVTVVCVVTPRKYDERQIHKLTVSYFTFVLVFETYNTIQIQLIFLQCLLQVKT